MSLLLDAANSIRDMNAPMNKGNISVTPDTRTGGNNVQDPYLSGYEGADASNSTTGKTDIQQGKALTTVPNAVPFNPSMSDMSGNNTRSYINIGTTAASTGSTLLKAAGKYLENSTLTSYGNTLGNAAGVAGLALSAYDIASGKANSQTYANLGSTAARQAIPYVAKAATSAGYTALGSGLSAIGSAVNIAMPYYALAKAGGMVINSITANNPDLKPTPFGRLGGSLEEPLAVEQYWAKEAARNGIGTPERNEAVATMNPLEVGGWIQDTTDKALNTVTGSVYGAGQVYDTLAKGDKSSVDVLTGGASGVFRIGKSTEDTARGGAAILTGGLSEIGCFEAGTPITMADGSIKKVEEIAIYDECEKGGIVTGTGIVLAEKVYNYKGIMVTGTHAVYENGAWVRIKDSKEARPVIIDEPIKVYVVNNLNHALMINGILFADYGEVTDSEDMTAQERLDYLNEHCRI
jgi:hypothetical protein